jgi:TRAP-type uncharacterized transport system fused permease subunit
MTKRIEKVALVLLAVGFLGITYDKLIIPMGMPTIMTVIVTVMLSASVLLLLRDWIKGG